MLAMANLLGADQRFVRCVEKQLLTYALQRPMVADDDEGRDAVHETFGKNGNSLKALVHGIVGSPLFLYRAPSSDEQSGD